MLKRAIMSGSNNLNSSILDRLIDNEPEVSFEAVSYRLVSLPQIRVRVIRDLENLLNTRAVIFDAPQEFAAVQQSLYRYGLQDFSSFSPNSSATKKILRQEIERTITVFEPRLRQVRVTLDSTLNEHHSLVFRVNAMLVVEPEREPIQFDAYYDINRGQYQVKG